tara:strand:+ start:1370 stop:1615 length:246 start_codon:yes stop_codon:yes gene_type:complete
MKKTPILKITDTELTKLQELNTESNKIKSIIGDLELQKIQIIEEHNELLRELKVHEKDLVKKYGEKIKIDLTTGNIEQVGK